MGTVISRTPLITPHSTSHLPMTPLPRVDTFSAAGSLVGLAAAAVLLPRSVPYYAMSLAGGAAAGTAAAVLLHTVTRPAEDRTPNKALHELMRGD